MSNEEMRGLFSIGDFSRITGITVKALRFYHEQGLLVPTLIDPQTGYRYYAESLIERARVIVYLRGLEFPIEEIRDLLAHADDGKILTAMEERKTQIQQRIRELRGVVRSLEQFISDQKRSHAMPQTDNQVQEKNLDAILIAGVRIKGRYSDSSKGFARLGKSFGRLIAGPPIILYYDNEYKEDDADFEVCFPIKQAKAVEGISIRELPRARCVTLIHKGPYDQMGPLRKIAQICSRQEIRCDFPNPPNLHQRPGNDLQR